MLFQHHIYCVVAVKLRPRKLVKGGDKHTFLASEPAGRWNEKLLAGSQNGMDTQYTDDLKSLCENGSNNTPRARGLSSTAQTPGFCVHISLGAAYVCVRYFHVFLFPCVGTGLKI
jgi:hypothetical protein